MAKFLRLFLPLAFTTVLAGFSHYGLAEVKVTIFDGSTTMPPAPPGNFKLSMLSPANQNTSLELLDCSHPCGVYFPSGTVAFAVDETKLTPPVAGDTFLFRDACGKGLVACNAGTVARVAKTDASTDKVELKGVQITALTNVTRKIRITFRTEPGDLKELNYSGGSYPFKVILQGKFTNKPPQEGGGEGLTTTCLNPNDDWEEGDLTDYCAMLTLTVNAKTADNVPPSATATSSLPCFNGSTVPCAPLNGTYLSDGYFNARDTGTLKVSCTPLPCKPKPYHRGTLRAVFAVPAQTLTLANSGIAGMSELTEEDGGIADLHYALAPELEDELGRYFWVASAPRNELYRAHPRMESSYKKSAGQVPIVFNLLYADLAYPSSGVTLTSIADDDRLPPDERVSNDRSYASFIAQPSALQWRNVKDLTLRYAVVTGESFSGDPRLEKVSFSECTKSQLRLQVRLTDKAGVVDAGLLTINLGSPDLFTSGCAAAASKLSDTNLVLNPEKRVDPTGLSGLKCCLTVQASQESSAGDLYVKWISLVVGPEPPDEHVANYKVVLLEGVVNGIKATSTLRVAGAHMHVATPPMYDRSIVITDETTHKIALEIPDSAITTDVEKKEVHFTLPLSELSVNQKDGYRVNLCLFGGRCVPKQGFFTLDP